MPYRVAGIGGKLTVSRDGAVHLEAAARPRAHAMRVAGVREAVLDSGGQWPRPC